MHATVWIWGWRYMNMIFLSFRPKLFEFVRTYVNKGGRVTMVCTKGNKTVLEFSPSKYNFTFFQKSF